MDTTTLRARFWTTVHEIADSKKACVTIGSMAASFITLVGGLVFAAWGKKLGLDDAFVAEIPKYSAGAAASIVGLAVNYVHGQAKVDQADVAAEAARPLADRERDLGKQVVQLVVRQDGVASPPTEPLPPSP